MSKKILASFKSKGNPNSTFKTVVMASEVSSEYEEETHNDTNSGERAHKRHHQSGKHLRDEPNTLTELQACLLSMSCFQHLACFEFCQRVANGRVHHELARLLHITYMEVSVSWLGSLSH